MESVYLSEEDQTLKESSVDGSDLASDSVVMSRQMSMGFERSDNLLGFKT